MIGKIIQILSAFVNYCFHTDSPAFGKMFQIKGLISVENISNEKKKSFHSEFQERGMPGR